MQECRKIVSVTEMAYFYKNVLENQKDLEKFLDKKVFLESYVKVDKDWRTSDSKLKKYGYGH